MKKIIISLFFVVPLFGASLDWLSSYDAAVSKARAEHKNIIVYIESNSCPYCHKFRADVLDTKDVIASLEQFVPLKLDINSPDTKKHFPKAVMTPTTYFITPDNQNLETIVGYLNEEFFYWRLDSAETEAIKISQKSNKKRKKK